MGKNKQTIQLHTESIIGLLGNLQLEYGYVSDDNVFKILNIEDKEIFHSRFLKYLISRNWDSFISFLKSQQILDKDENVGRLLSSQCEFFCPALKDCPESKNGRIDLYFEAQNHVVAIEVKWHAGEQPIQLLRYHQYLNKLRGQTPHTLIFLTPTKWKAQKISCNNICDKKCSLTESDYKLLSFRELNEWLLENLKGADSIGLISQYSEILMRETKNMCNADKILTSIDDEGKFAVACAFADSMGEVKQKIRDAFFNAIDDQLKIRGYMLSDPTKGKTYEIKPKDSEMSLNCYIAYDTNLYCQKGDKWWYITPTWFTEGIKRASKSDTEKGTSAENKIDIAGLYGKDNPVVKWYFMKQDNKDKTSMIKQVTENILMQLELELE